MKTFSLTAFCGILFAMTTISGCTSIFNDCVDGSGERQTETRQLSPFHSIVIKGSADVTFQQGTEQELVITTDNNILPVISTTVSNNVLTVDAERCYSTSNGLQIEVTIPDLQSFKIEGSGSLRNLPSTSHEGLKLNDLHLEIEGSGDILLNDLLMNTLTLIVEGSGEISATGSGETIDIIIKGSGDITADQFIVKEAEASISGSGEIRVQALEALRAAISGSGDIYYRGSPATLETSISGSGDIIKLN